MSREICRSRAPLRLGLAGGGTDVQPYSDRFGGAILNVTIGRYANATVELLDEPKLRFASLDLNQSEQLSCGVPVPLDTGLVLHRAAYNTIMAHFNDGHQIPMAITTHVESPIGSGLGSSSALVVAIVEAIREALRIPLGEYEVAHLAYHIEREVAGLAGGQQDQFAATFGGVNYMEFHAQNRVIVNPLRVSRAIWNEIESSLLLCFTGVSRASARIIEDQVRSIGSSDGESLDAMHQLKADAMEMKNAVLTGDIDRMAAILQHSWQAKKRTSSAMTTPEINELYNRAMEAGARGGKISGAGGGGFMFFLVDPIRRSAVLAALGGDGRVVSPCHLVHRGAESWRVSGRTRRISREMQNAQFVMS